MKPHQSFIRGLLNPITVWLCFLLLLVAAGCVHVNLGASRAHYHSSTYQTRDTPPARLPLPDDQQMCFQYHTRDGHATLESERVVLVFHGLTAKRRQLFHFHGDQQAVRVAGEGGSGVSVTCATDQGTVVFRSDYANGTNTLQFDGQTVRLAQGGCLLLAGDQAVDLSEGRKTIHVKGGKIVAE